MAELVRPIPKCSDRAVLSFFGELSERLAFPPVGIQVAGSNDVLPTNEHTNLVEEIKESSGCILQFASSHRANANYNQQGAVVTFSRGAPRTNASGNIVVVPSLTLDTLRVEQATITVPEALILNDAIDRHLVGSASPLLSTGREDEGLKDLVISHHQLITALHEQIASIGTKYHDARIELENEVADRKRELNAATELQRKELEDGLSEERAKLQAERDRIAAREAELDDRNNTHVRREIRTQLKNQLASYKDKFELTRGTRRLRLPITITVIAIELFCAAIIALLIYLPPADTADIWTRLFFWLKTVTASFLAAGTAVWYLRWLTQWSNRHADAEFQLKQLELDVDRASWVVETAFEWKSSQESSIPEPLLAAISRNLFDAAKPKADTEESPLDHLASALLGEASKARIKLAGGHEVDFERKALRKAGQD